PAFGVGPRSTAKDQIAHLVFLFDGDAVEAVPVHCTGQLEPHLGWWLAVQSALELDEQVKDVLRSGPVEGDMAAHFGAGVVADDNCPIVDAVRRPVAELVSPKLEPAPGSEFMRHQADRIRSVAGMIAAVGVGSAQELEIEADPLFKI